MNDIVEIFSLLASLVHYPRMHIFILFSLIALIPCAAIACFWARRRPDRPHGLSQR